MGCPIEPSLNVVVTEHVVTEQVQLEQRVEVHERLREVKLKVPQQSSKQQPVPGAASALGILPRRAEHGLCLTPHSAFTKVHEEAGELKVLVHRAGRRQKSLARILGQADPRL